MSIRMRIERIDLDAGSEHVVFDLARPCTVLHGPVGTGKSSLLELIKYVLGGNGILTNVVRNEVRGVSAVVNLNGNRVELRRAIGKEANYVEIFEPHGGLVATHSIRPRPDQATISDALLELLGFPRVSMPRARTKATAATVPLTFNDLFGYLYVEQQNIDRSVVHHTEVFREPKRRAVFELLFGLTDPEALSLETELGRTREALAEAQSRLTTIQQFISATALEDEGLLRRKQLDLGAAATEAEARLEALRTEVTAGTLAFEGLRQRVLSAEHEFRSTIDDAQKLASEVARRENLLALHHIDAAREDKARAAGRRFAPLEFVVCPRCMQSLEDDRAMPGTCHLCLQPEVTSPMHSLDEPLDDQDSAEEIELLLADARADAALAQRRRESAQLRLDMLRRELDISTAEAVAPRFQEIELLSSARATALALTQAVQSNLQLWAEVGDLGNRVAVLEGRRDELADSLRQSRARRDARMSILDELSSLFDDTVAALEVPWARSASIDKSTYLPLIDGEKFDTIAVAGGTKTVVSVAYHLTLLGFALSHGDTLLPQILIMDTPRKNLGANPNDRDMGERIYRRIRTLVEAYEDKVQFIIADNDSPGRGAWFRGYRFSYEAPLIPHVAHPGEEAVLSGQLETIGADV